MDEDYQYYVVESSFVARVGKGTTERYTREGKWVPYDDLWDVITNGVLLDEDEDPLQVARELFADT